MPKLFAALLTGCVLAALTPLGTAQAGTGPVINSASLTSGGKPCSATTPPVMQGFFASLLEAAGSDDTYSSSDFIYTFSIWPLADPAAARSVTAHGYSSGSMVHAQLPADVLSDGTSYAWRVQVATSNGTSPWSQVCTFAYDYTDPAMPTVSSPNYPPYGEGVAAADQFGQFTFDSGGDPDTVGFYYAWTQDLPAYACSFGGPLGQLVCPDVLAGPNIVRVTSPGGTASITLAPVSEGPQTLSVAALDAAGNRSPAVRYQTYVPGSAPLIRRPDSRPICGGTAKVVFAPNPWLTSKVSSYTYTFDTNPAVTVPAGADGTAQVSLKVNREPAPLQVTSLSTNGFQSTEAYMLLNVNPQPFVYSWVYTNYGQPVGGVGVAAWFQFSAPYTDGAPVTSFSYRFPDGPVKTVAAGDWGDTAVQWAPTRAGQQTLTVQAMRADGTPASCTASYTFTVAR